MSQEPLSNTERIQAVQAFGYTEREAHFLMLAALHGGYFLRRQFCQFLSQTNGGIVAVLIDKTLTKGHVSVTTFNHNTHVYHLCSRPFYAAIGQSDNRNRRERRPPAVKNRLMGLDFVLAHSGADFLGAERDKIDYFTTQRAVPLEQLPAKIFRSRTSRATTTRYFLDKYPIFVSPQEGADMVSFCFVDEGVVTPSRFESYLQAYARLFAALGQFRLIYVCTLHRQNLWAERIFERFLASQNRIQGAPSDTLSARLLKHFPVRLAYESKEFSALSKVSLVQFRLDRQEFGSQDFNQLFGEWKRLGDRVVLEKGMSPEAKSKPVDGFLIRCRLEYHYEHFGTLTAY